MRARLLPTLLKHSAGSETEKQRNVIPRDPSSELSARAGREREREREGERETRESERERARDLGG